MAITLYVYSYSYLPLHFPTSMDDGTFYNRAGLTFSENLKSGTISFKTPTGYKKYQTISQHSNIQDDKMYSRYSSDPTAVLYMVFIGLTYFVFGYNPFLIRILNIIVFQLSYVEFSRIIDSFNIRNQIKKRLKLCYLFFPVFIFYSSTMLKEAFVVYFTVALLSDVLLGKKISRMAFHTVGLLMLRFYNAFIILIPFVLTKLSLKRMPSIKIIVIVIAFLIVAWDSRFLGSFSLKYILFQIPIYMKLSLDSSRAISATGILDGIISTFTNPIQIINAFFRGFIDMFLNPKFWKIQFVPWGDKYFFINICERLTSWFSWFILMMLFPYKSLIFKNKYSYFILLYIIVLLFAGIHPHTRYTYVFITILLVLIGQLNQYTRLSPPAIKSQYLLFFSLSFFLIVVDYVFIGSSLF